MKKNQTEFGPNSGLEEHAGDSVKIIETVHVQERLEMEVRKLEMGIWLLFVWERVSKLFE